MVKPDLLRLYYHVKDHTQTEGFLGSHTLNGHEYMAFNHGSGRLHLKTESETEYTATFLVDNMTANELESQVILWLKQVDAEI